MPLQYWSYAIHHVVAAKNAVPHASTNQVPYKIAFNKAPDYVQHLRQFGCKALYAPVTKSLNIFEARLYPGICLGHYQGGLYHILGNGKIWLTKHEKMIENEFPGTHSFAIENQKYGSSNTVNENTEVYIDLHNPIDIEQDSPSESIAPEDATNENIVEDYIEISKLTYVPEKPSTFGEETEQSSSPNSSQAIES